MSKSYWPAIYKKWQIRVLDRRAGPNSPGWPQPTLTRVRLPTDQLKPLWFQDREAFWINTLKTLETRGFNVRNERPVKHRVNFFRHQQQKAQRRANMAQRPLHDRPLAGSSASTAHGAMHGSIAMPGALRNSSYARTAHLACRNPETRPTPPPETFSLQTIQLSNTCHR